MTSLERPRFDPPVPDEACRGGGSRDADLSPARVCAECQSACEGCRRPTGLIAARLCSDCWRKQG